MPFTLELPDLQTQTEFNVTRWAEILADCRLAKLPERIETGSARTHHHDVASGFSAL
ncbi:MAG: hypothetical protein JO077_00235 [Verrucomicrobia bacterium]|nr:hypothetical protein [Verrucomicrobiota bacterium]